jgi:hypothetical protein
MSRRERHPLEYCSGAVGVPDVTLGPGVTLVQSFIIPGVVPSTAIDVGPGAAKRAPPAINHKEKETMTTTTITVVGNLTRDPEIRSLRSV